MTDQLTGTGKSILNEAIQLPRGARYYRCALHVNSYTYLNRHGKASRFGNEEDYNAAMIQACKEHDVEVIAVTDHYRIAPAQRLIEAATNEGIIVFPGFEASTKNGIHFLILFDPGTETTYVKDCIGRVVPVTDREKPSPRGDCDIESLLRKCKDWGAVSVAAHVCSNSGLLKELSGETRIEAWKHNNLLAVSLPGPPEDAPPGERDILLNKNGDYRRDRLPAVINAQDIDDPSDFEKGGTTTRIKMVDPTTEGLRQAFLDQESRILLNTDPEPQERDEFVAMTWTGGFLDGVKIHFNEDLNVLIGGRGAGKSTVIESLRYVLQNEPIGDDARQLHESMIKNVVQSGTKISLLVRLSKPSRREYVIERTCPDPPTVRDEKGNVLEVKPTDILPEIEIYGQHEIAELAKDRTKLIRLLDRFVDTEVDLEQKKETHLRLLKDTRRRLTDIQRKVGEIDEKLDQLPAINEKLRQFKDAGIEAKLENQTKLLQEEQVLRTANDRIETLNAVYESLDEALPLDAEFVSDDDLEPLPNADVLQSLRGVFQTLNTEARTATVQLETALNNAREELQNVRETWVQRKEQAQQQYEQTLRELQQEDIDGDEYLRLRSKVEELRPLEKERKELAKEKLRVEQERRNLLNKYTDSKQEEYQAYESACRRVSQSLGGRVKATVTFQGDRLPLIDLLNEKLEGRRKSVLERLEKKKDLSLTNLSHLITEGAEALQEAYDLTDNQAEKLANIDANLRMQIEELDLPPSTQIMLNIAPEDDSREWRSLDGLSTGQKATAVLLLLLVESQTPLIVDQPEDDLDNRFVVEGVIPAVRKEKGRRQLLFATHNANIPVLGDAEQILGFTPTGEASGGHAEIKPEHRGAIDQPSISSLVEDILEGGETAFELRRLKYGF